MPAPESLARAFALSTFRFERLSLYVLARLLRAGCDADLKGFFNVDSENNLGAKVFDVNIAAGYFDAAAKHERPPGGVAC